MKKLNIYFLALYVIVFCFAFIACSGSVESKSSINDTDTDTERPKELSDDLDSLMFQLDGVIYTLPFQFAELEENGWELRYMTSYRLAPFSERFNIGVYNGEKEIVVAFLNLSGNRLRLREAYISRVSIREYSQVQAVLPGNIVIGTTIYEEIIATFGQPGGRDELDDRVILRYYGENARTFMRIDMQTDIISRVNLLMTDAALRRIIEERGGG